MQDLAKSLETIHLVLIGLAATLLILAISPDETKQLSRVVATLQSARQLRPVELQDSIAKFSNKLFYERFADLGRLAEANGCAPRESWKPSALDAVRIEQAPVDRPLHS